MRFVLDFSCDQSPVYLLSSLPVFSTKQLLPFPTPSYSNIHKARPAFYSTPQPLATYDNGGSFLIFRIQRHDHDPALTASSSASIPSFSLTRHRINRALALEILYSTANRRRPTPSVPSGNPSAGKKRQKIRDRPDLDESHFIRYTASLCLCIDRPDTRHSA